MKNNNLNLKLKEKLLIYWSALSDMLETKTIRHDSIDVIFEDLISLVNNKKSRR